MKVVAGILYILPLVLAILADGSCHNQQAIFKWVDDPMLRGQGYGDVLNTWGDDLWIANYAPSE
jgi:hypothetical protein